MIHYVVNDISSMMTVVLAKSCSLTHHLTLQTTYKKVLEVWLCKHTLHVAWTVYKKL